MIHIHHCNKYQHQNAKQLHVSSYNNSPIDCISFRKHCYCQLLCIELHHQVTTGRTLPMSLPQTLKVYHKLKSALKTCDKGFSRVESTTFIRLADCQLRLTLVSTLANRPHHIQHS